MDLQEKLKAKINTFIVETGMKPYQVADGAEVPHTSIYAFLKDEKDIALKTASQISNFIDTYREKNDLV